MASVNNRRADGERTLSPEPFPSLPFGDAEWSVCSYSPPCGADPAIPRFDSGRPTMSSTRVNAAPIRSSCGGSRERWRGRRVYSVAPSMIPPARRLFPSDATGSIRDSGSRHRDSNPRRGAMPIPLRNTQSLFSFRSEGRTEPRGQSLASMDTVWRAAFRQRCPPSVPLRRNSPVGQGSGVRLQPCGKGRQRRLRQPGWRRSAKPCMAGFDSRNRLSSDTSKAGRIHAAVEPDSSP